MDGMKYSLKGHDGMKYSLKGHDGMKYTLKGHKDGNRHKNRIKRSGQALSKTKIATSLPREGEPAGMIIIIRIIIIIIIIISIIIITMIAKYFLVDFDFCTGHYPSYRICLKPR